MDCDRCSRRGCFVSCIRCGCSLCSCRIHVHAMNCLKRDVNAPVAHGHKHSDEPKPMVQVQGQAAVVVEEKKESSRSKLQTLSRMKRKKK